MPYPEPDKVRRELKLIVFVDNSIAIINGKGEIISFFADDVVAPTIVNNLEELGEL